MDENLAITVNDVSKHFMLPHERSHTIKSMITGVLSGKMNRQVSKQQALKNISFAVKKGEFFGIVGRNGSGKSTLLKMLAGIYQPNKGSVEINGKLVPFIELGVGFNGELTGRENVYLNGALLGFSKKEVDAQYKDIVEFAELEEFMDQKLKNYSSGMQVRLAFSLATRAKTDILLVDEVLAVGDADFQRKCFRYFRELKRNKKTVIFVSHDMSAVQEYCDRAILIENSELVLEGNAYDVGSAYTRMFSEQTDGPADLSKIQRRWGNKKATFNTVKVNPRQITTEKELTISGEFTVHKNLEELIVGFKVRETDGSGTTLFGTNSKIQRKELKNLKKGEKYTVEWQVPNILNDGQYSLDVALVGQDYAETYDSWDEAGVVSVEKIEPNPYPSAPIITTKISRKNQPS